MPSGKAFWPKNYNPVPGGFGAMFQTLAVALGTAGPALVGTATTNIYVPIPRSKTFFIAAANMTGAVAFAGGSTVTGQLFKNATALTAAYDLKTATSGNNVDIPITATDEEATVAPGDVVYWAVAAATTITTTGDLRACIEASIMK